MRRGLIVPALFLVAAVATGINAGHSVASAVDHTSLRAVLVAIYDSLRTVVAFAFAVFTVRRAAPARTARGIVALVACAVALGSVVVLRAPGAGTPPGLELAGDLLAAVSVVWLLGAVLALGRCFGVLPEARGLVTRGPYRVVRHPVYLGEIGACMGLTLAAPWAWNVVVLAVFLAAQGVRMRLEERALGDAFAEYAAYAARTPRLLPRMRTGGGRVAGAERAARVAAADPSLP